MSRGRIASGPSWRRHVPLGGRLFERRRGRRRALLERRQRRLGASRARRRAALREARICARILDWAVHGGSRGSRVPAQRSSTVRRPAHSARGVRGGADRARRQCDPVGARRARGGALLPSPGLRRRLPDGLPGGQRGDGAPCVSSESRGARATRSSGAATSASRGGVPRRRRERRR